MHKHADKGDEMNSDKMGKDGSAAARSSCVSTRTTLRINFKGCLRLFALFPLVAFVHQGMSADYISVGNSVPPNARPVAAANYSATSAGPPCSVSDGASDRQVDTAIGSVVLGTSSLGDGTKDAAGEFVADVMIKKGIVGPGVADKATKENADVRASIENYYQEYRRLADEGKVTPELRDQYAKEKIGPRLDRININEVNWLGKEPERSRMAGQVKAKIELVGIERQAGEKNALRFADENVLEQQKYKSKSKDPDYQPLSQEEARKRQLEIFIRDFEKSPQYLEAERMKTSMNSAKAEIESRNQPRIRCQATEAATEALPRRGGNAGSALFQNAINQAEQDERDPPAREARERAAKLRAIEQERQASARAAADARAEARDGASWGDLIRGVADVVKARADSKAKASGSGRGQNGNQCPDGYGLVNDKCRAGVAQ